MALKMSFQSILNLPLSQKCTELNIFIDNCNLNTLETIFPLLIDDIFGLGGTNSPGNLQTNPVGWNLRQLSHDLNNKNFISSYNFLSPNGYLFKIIYNLFNTDLFIKYQFPLYYLPLELQKSISEGGCLSDFYLDKLYIDPKTSKALYLYLNPFEYYMFHFIRYLCENKKYIQNSMSNNIEDVSPNIDTLYQRLLAVYCDKFLPLCNNLPIEPNIFYSYNISTSLNTSNIIRSPTNKSSLFKPGVISTQSPNSSFNSSSPPHNISTSSPNSSGNTPCLGEVWRSELLLHLFVDFWLQYDETLDLGLPKLVQPPFPQMDNRSMMNNNFMWMIPVFPSGYQVRCIRYVIKHLHQFSSKHLQDSSSMGELRRATLPMTQNKIYQFLRHNISHWPLDSSFKLIQETWFSFIQPWRYSNISLATTNQLILSDNDEDLSCQSVDRYWINFIADNILSYSNLFHLVIARFSNIDLNNLFNVHMLFRLAKVYSVPNLCQLLREIESDLFNDKFGNNYGPLTRQTMLKLEGVNFQYEKLFSIETTKKMMNLINMIQHSILYCDQQLKTPRQTISFWQSVQREIHQFLFNYSCVPKINENTRSNLQHTVRYLNQAKEWFCIMFEIPIPPSPTYDESSSCESTSFTSINRTIDNTYTADTMNDTMNSHNNSSFIPESSLTLKAMHKKIRHLKYDGDPDLLPANSYEVEWLVKILYEVSCRLNIAFSDRFQQIYNENNFKSLILRSLLLPPTTIYKYEKHNSLCYDIKVPIHLPSRISLRRFASYSTLIYLFLFILFISSYLNVNYFIALLIIIMLCFSIEIIKYQIKTFWF